MNANIVKGGKKCKPKHKKTHDKKCSIPPKAIP
jgi:hypothetical protein